MHPMCDGEGPKRKSGLPPLRPHYISKTGAPPETWDAVRERDR